MKRTPLQRRIPLARSSCLTRRAPLTGATGTPERPRAGRLPGTRPAGNPIPASSRTTVRDRSGGQCEIRSHLCTGRAVEQHHRKRRRDGGHAPSNLLDTCRECHDLAHAEPAYARRRGWIVSAFEVDPAQVPVHYGATTSWFADDGTKTTQLPKRTR